MHDGQAPVQAGVWDQEMGFGVAAGPCFPLRTEQ